MDEPRNRHRQVVRGAFRHALRVHANHVLRPRNSDESTVPAGRRRHQLFNPGLNALGRRDPAVKVDGLDGVLILDDHLELHAGVFAVHFGPARVVPAFDPQHGLREHKISHAVPDHRTENIQQSEETPRRAACRRDGRGLIRRLFLVRLGGSCSSRGGPGLARRSRRHCARCRITARRGCDGFRGHRGRRRCGRRGRRNWRSLLGFRGFLRVLHATRLHFRLRRRRRSIHPRRHFCHGRLHRRHGFHRRFHHLGLDRGHRGGREALRYVPDPLLRLLAAHHRPVPVRLPPHTNVELPRLRLQKLDPRPRAHHRDLRQLIRDVLHRGVVPERGVHQPEPHDPRKPQLGQLRGNILHRKHRKLRPVDHARHPGGAPRREIVRHEPVRVAVERPVHAVRVRPAAGLRELVGEFFLDLDVVRAAVEVELALRGGVDADEPQGGAELGERGLGEEFLHDGGADAVGAVDGGAREVVGEGEVGECATLGVERGRFDDGGKRGGDAVEVRLERFGFLFLAPRADRPRDVPRDQRIKLRRRCQPQMHHLRPQQRRARRRQRGQPRPGLPRIERDHHRRPRPRGRQQIPHRGAPRLDRRQNAPQHRPGVLRVHQRRREDLPLPREHRPGCVDELQAVVAGRVVRGGDHERDGLAGVGAGAERGEGADAERDGGEEGGGRAEAGSAEAEWDGGRRECEV
mmetsp:Transcript_837/g.2187  ORF Transcript_837/g.2187 Transcript_837/m.2187 type:complete len:689 (+) Transcript_837:2782-4848(+)